MKPEPFGFLPLQGSDLSGLAGPVRLARQGTDA